VSDPRRSPSDKPGTFQGNQSKSTLSPSEREIGIRLAIGARGREVLLQFLIEAVVLSAMGGIFGMLLGLGGSYAATRALSIPFTVSADILVIALSFSATVGIAFGFFPARKAARLKPIEALRHE
jgi:putative ABC transport system permease protein